MIIKKNNSIILFLWLLLSPGLLSGQIANGSVGSPRVIFSINEQWRFIYTENDCEYSSLPIADWQQINLPHTWNVNNTLSDTSAYQRGIGWYEKRISLPKNSMGKQIYLDFEGANQITEVFVNGRFAGKHSGGYTAFSFDITSLVQFDQGTNTILVKVDNQFNEGIPPLSADFTFYGGIYRDVWLIVTEDVHFSLNEYGSKGLYISTPQVNAELAKVLICGEIQNHSDENKEIVLVNTIFGPDDEPVARDEIDLSVKSGTLTDFQANEITIHKPELWSPNNPNLYAVKTEIYKLGILTDVLINPLGLRWYELSSDSGFYLNGKVQRLIGTNRHQDYEGQGNALENQLHINDLEMIKNAGFNFLRLAHYPQDPAVLEAADRLGLIIWEEIPIVNYITVSEEFSENCHHMLKEMIYQHFNHPSIVFWGLMNEVFLHDADGMRNREMNFPEEYLRSTLKLADELDSIANQEDPDRLTVMAAHHSDLYDETGLSSVADAMGYNLYQGWYSDHIDDFGKSLDNMHRNAPDRKIMISEYGAGSDERIHSENPQRFDFSTEYQQLFHESYIKQILDRPYLAASAVWAQNDFGSNRRGDTQAKINQKGLQYFNRQPKDSYYLYKAILSDKPTVHIASHGWSTRFNSSENQKFPLKIYTNFSKLEIYVDHKSSGSFSIDESCILDVDLDLSVGNHLIEARGMSDNSVYTDQVKLDILDDGMNHIGPNTGQREILVNVGSSGQYQDKNGLIWRKDREYLVGFFGYTGGESSSLYGSKSVLGTKNDPVFQTYRKGLTSYRFDVPPGMYEVELCFAEMEHHNENERVMDISINGSTIWENLDLVKDYGYLQAVNRKFVILTHNQENIEITLLAKKGVPILNGVRIRKK